MTTSTALSKRLRESAIARHPELEAELSEIEGSEGLFTLLGASFHGGQAWIIYFLYALGIAAFLLALYCLRGYLGAGSLEQSLDWALGLLGCLFLFSLIKTVGYQQLVKVELQHALTRIETRLAVLSHELKKTD